MSNEERARYYIKKALQIFAALSENNDSDYYIESASAPNYDYDANFERDVVNAVGNAKRAIELFLEAELVGEAKQAFDETVSRLQRMNLNEKRDYFTDWAQRSHPNLLVDQPLSPLANQELFEQTIALLPEARLKTNAEAAESIERILEQFHLVLQHSEKTVPGKPEKGSRKDETQGQAYFQRACEALNEYGFADEIDGLQAKWLEMDPSSAKPFSLEKMTLGPIVKGLIPAENPINARVQKANDCIELASHLLKKYVAEVRTNNEGGGLPPKESDIEDAARNFQKAIELFVQDGRLDAARSTYKSTIEAFENNDLSDKISSLTNWLRQNPKFFTDKSVLSPAKSRPVKSTVEESVIDTAKNERRGATALTAARVTLGLYDKKTPGNAKAEKELPVSISASFQEAIGWFMLAKQPGQASACLAEGFMAFQSRNLPDKAVELAAYVEKQHPDLVRTDQALFEAAIAKFKNIEDLKKWGGDGWDAGCYQIATDIENSVKKAMDAAVTAGKPEVASGYLDIVVPMLRKEGHPQHANLLIDFAKEISIPVSENLTANIKIDDKNREAIVEQLAAELTAENEARKAAKSDAASTSSTPTSEVDGGVKRYGALVTLDQLLHNQTSPSV